MNTFTTVQEFSRTDQGHNQFW